MKIKRIFPLFIFILLTFVSCSIVGGNSDVQNVDLKNYSIVTGANASKEVLALANELSSSLGSDCQIKNDTQPAEAHEIIIGTCKRDDTLYYEAMLDKYSKDTAFHFVIGEKNGKIIILADENAGYNYVLDYLLSTYSKNGVLSLPKNTNDMQSVTWMSYYASEFYKESAAWQEEQKRFEEEQKVLENEMNRFEENKDSAEVMTKKEAIEYYKNLATGFNSADFGNYTADAFNIAIEKSGYSSPEAYPNESHPRILFTPDTIDDVRKNLTAEENKTAYSAYMTLADTPCDGKLPAVGGNIKYNFREKYMDIIEAKAFCYAMTGDKIYGYQAIYAIKNIILTLDIPKGTLNDSTRAWGYVLYITAIVYDWCYDLLTEEDKAQLISGCVTMIGPHMEIVNYDGEKNLVPTAQGPVYGHGGETQFLRDWLAFAIAVTNEAPEIYEFVGGRTFEQYREAQNYFFESGSHWEGSSYGYYRFYNSVWAHNVISVMTGGKTKLFTDKLEDVAITFMHYIRPDNQAIRIGDIVGETRKEFNFGGFVLLAFYVGNAFENSYLKTYAWNGTKEFSDFNHGEFMLTPVKLLCVNDPSISHNDTSTLSLTRTTTTPLTSLLARNSHNDINAFMVYMSMPESYGASHAHMKCGSFQIYYKGILASNSGKYTTWGGEHHMGYSMQTISSNSLLIYNPNLAEDRNAFRPNMIYSGGQSIAYERALLPTNLKDILASPASNQCVSLGTANVEKNGVYLYSYMGGDMTNAYDAVTVDEVTRYMFAVATNDRNRPLVFVTFDRITSDDASYRKSALIHMQEEPVITDDGFAIITNTKGDNNGKLIVQSVMSETEMTIIGGEGKEFWINDLYGNLYADTSDAEYSIAEYGWGRIEISPKEQNLTDHLLTVMYVTDADNKSAPIKASDVSTENLAGTVIMNKAMFFPKNEKLLTEEATLSASASGSVDYFVCGISAGEWIVYSGNTAIKTITVEEGTNLLTFTANADTYTIKPAN